MNQSTREILIRLVLGLSILLCALPANASPPDKKATAALFAAIESGNVEGVRNALSKANIANAEKQFGETALMCASGYGESSIVKLLLDHGAKVESPDSTGSTALIWAVDAGRQDQMGDLPTVTLLLKRGAFVNKRIDNGSTALMESAATGNSQIVKLLLAKGSQVNFKNQQGMTALMTACLTGKHATDIIRQLLSHGAKVDARDNSGATALFWVFVDADDVAVHERLDRIKLLVEHGANVNAVDKSGNTVLLSAISEKKLENHEMVPYEDPSVIQYLISKGADVSKPERDGETPLAEAQQLHQSQVVQLLQQARSYTFGK